MGLILNNIISIVQVIAYICLSHFFKWFYNIEVKIPKELLRLQKNRYIIVANHKKAIDSFVILSTLPYNSFNVFLPFRFLVANIYLKYWWQRLLLIPLGSIRAYLVEGKLSGIEGALQCSDREQTLFIFPEGRRVTPNTQVKLKTGIAYLAQKRNFIIIPVSIEYITSNELTRTKVSWGKPFTISNSLKSKDFRAITKNIFSRVQILSSQ